MITSCRFTQRFSTSLRVMWIPCVILFCAFASPALAQPGLYTPFPGKAYLNITYGRMHYSPNISNVMEPFNMVMIGATVERNFIMRSDTLVRGGVADPILGGRFIFTWGLPLYFPMELNLKLSLGRQPIVPYISAGVAEILNCADAGVNDPGHAWNRSIRFWEPYLVLGLGVEMHPLFTAELKWWHSFETETIRAFVNDNTQEWQIHVDIFSLTFGIPL